VKPAFRTRFPRGATFIIVRPNLPADLVAGETNNVESGTSAARGTYQQALPLVVESDRRSRLVGKSEIRNPKSEMTSEDVQPL
jgi:hypothetical protein